MSCRRGAQSRKRHRRLPARARSATKIGGRPVREEGESAVRLESRDVEWADGQTVSSVWAFPEEDKQGSRRALVIAHGAGGDMHHSFIKYFQEGVCRSGLLAVRFNFPYKEARRRAPDPAPRLEACFRSVIATVRRDPYFAGGEPGVVIGGKSMGGRMASHLASQGEELDGLFLLGYPLHPPHRTSQLRSAHLSTIDAPTLFIQGDRDSLCDLALLRDALRSFKAPVRLHVIPSGDHSFKPSKSSGLSEREALGQALDVLLEWLASLR